MKKSLYQSAATLEREEDGIAKTLSAGDAFEVTVPGSVAHVMKLMSADSHTGIGSNSYQTRLMEILSEITKLGTLPEESPFHVHSDIAKYVRSSLAYLAYNYPIDDPKLFPESGECLSLTWEAGNLKQYLSFYRDAVDLTYYNKALNLSCHEFLVDGGLSELNLDELGLVLSTTGAANSSTGK